MGSEMCIRDRTTAAAAIASKKRGENRKNGLSQSGVARGRGMVALQVLECEYSLKKSHYLGLIINCDNSCTNYSLRTLNYILQRPEVEPGLREELLRDEEDNKMICVSVQDDFVLKQDICVMCGSLGNDFEGRLIACTQCGQCYHPHCVNIRVRFMNSILFYF